jgi:hypothetical protein
MFLSSLHTAMQMDILNILHFGIAADETGLAFPPHRW